jgi:hypothetical protein
MTPLKAILVGLAYWLSTGLGLAVILALSELIRTGEFHIDKPGAMLGGGALSGFVCGFIGGVIVGKFSSLIFAGMCFLRPWAFPRLLAVAPVWGLGIGLVGVALASWSRSNKNLAGMAANWSGWVLAVIAAALWLVPWLWKREGG